MRGAATPARPCRADVGAGYNLGVDCYEQLWSPVILPVAAALIPWLGLAGRSIVVDAGPARTPRFRQGSGNVAAMAPS